MGFAVYASERPGAIVLVISATLAEDAKSAARGWLMDGKASSLPALYESGDALLRLQFNAWAGLYTRPQPLVRKPRNLYQPQPDRARSARCRPHELGRGLVEFGLAGATRVACPTCTSTARPPA